MKSACLKSALVGGLAGAVMATGTTALAGSGINDVFNLGVVNAVDGVSVLRGTTADAQLRVTNQSGSNAAIAVHGLHSAAAGNAAGVQGETSSTSGSATGVFGRVASSNSATGSAAVRGLNSGKGIGVYGRNPNDVPSSYGVLGEGRYGVVGKSLFDGPSSYGVYGEGRYGLVGKSMSTGASSGIWGGTRIGFAGVEGHEEENPDGYGVYGRTDSPYDGTGAGIFGFETTSSGTASGVRAETNSTAYGASALYARVNPTAISRDEAAVRAVNNATNQYGMGVWGSIAGSGWGVLGESGPSGIGVVGKVNGSGGVGVHGEGGPGGVGVKGVGHNTQYTVGYAGQFVGEVDVQGYLKLKVTQGGPPDNDCIYPFHRGRMVFDDNQSGFFLWICTPSGWAYFGPFQGSRAGVRASHRR